MVHVMSTSSNVVDEIISIVLSSPSLALTLWTSCLIRYVGQLLQSTVLTHGIGAATPTYALHQD